MNMPPGFDPMFFWTELLYTIIVAAFCFVIYAKTKKIYDLTYYKGISYFRIAFMFFGASYLVRFFLHLNLLSRITAEMSPLVMPFQQSVMPVLTYLSTMAIFFIVYSNIWKNVKETNFLIIANLVAGLLSIVPFIWRTHMLVLLIQIVLVSFAVLMIFTKNDKHQKVTETRMLYVLTLVFWLISLIILGPRPMVPYEPRVLFQLASLIIFFYIYFKVTKWIK